MNHFHGKDCIHNCYLSKFNEIYIPKIQIPICEFLKLKLDMLIFFNILIFSIPNL